MHTTLLIMAAGMGSRFGGNKQTARLGPNGELLLHYSLYDAAKAGFDKVVFVIKRAMEAEFRTLVEEALPGGMEAHYVFQEFDNLPGGFTPPEGRMKPYGTVHAVLAAKDVIHEPFAVINADDYYGANAFDEMQRHLATAKAGEFAMTAFRLGNTLSKNGTVSRGVCELKEGYLKRVTEVTGISPDGSYDKNGTRVTLAADTPVSMNLWGLTPDIFPLLEAEFSAFLKHADLLKDELYIPSVISRALEAGRATVKVLQSADKWYGITYREDLAEVKEAIGAYLREGLYEGI